MGVELRAYEFELCGNGQVGFLLRTKFHPEVAAYKSRLYLCCKILAELRDAYFEQVTLKHEEEKDE